MEDLKELKMDLSSSYAARVSNGQARKIKEEIFSDYDKIVEFDLRKEADEAISFMMDLHKGDLGVILRGFEDADEEVKQEISPKIKGFYEGRSFQMRRLLIY